MRFPTTSSAPSSSSLDEARDLPEVVREVGVDHDDVVAAGGREPGQVCAPVAAPRLLDDARAGGSREIAAPVGRAVVDDDHLARRDRSRRARRARCVTHSRDRLCLVEARDDDGDASVDGAAAVTATATSAWEDMSACGSASSTTACSRTRSVARSAGTATSPSGWRRRGHDVTFLTLRQWGRGAEPDVPGVRVVAVGPQDERCTRAAGGAASAAADRLRPRRASSISSATATLRRRAHGVVPVLLAPAPWPRRAGARRVSGSSSTGTRSGREATGASTSGRLGGRIGWRIQRACLRVPQRAFCFSRLHERRLRELGLRGELTRLEGQYEGRSSRPSPSPPTGGRLRRPPHPGEARAGCSCPLSRWRGRRFPELRGEIYGDGPEREKVVPSDRRARARGRRLGARLRRTRGARAGARDGALPRSPVAARGIRSRRHRGRRRGVPVVVVAGPDNAATELVEEGVNGADRARRRRPTSSRAAILRSTGRLGAPRLDRRLVSTGTRNASRSSGRSETVLEAYASG